MKINLSIHYNTTFGQQICVCGSATSLGSWEVSKAVKLTHVVGGYWSTTLNIPGNTTRLE